MTQDPDRCSLCGVRFRMEDAVGTFRDELVHARCLPRASRFPDDFDDLDDDSAEAERR